MKYLVFYSILELDRTDCFIFDTEWEREDFMYTMMEECPNVDQQFMFYQKDWTIDGDKAALSYVYLEDGCQCGSPALGQAAIKLPELFHEFVEDSWEDI